MALTLVLGPANSAKAGEVLGAFADAAPHGALLVVPTAADAEHYSRELAEQGCVLRSVLTFSGLVAEIARRAGYSARRLTELQRERILRRVIAGGSFGALEAVAGTPGFLVAARELISELERSLVSAPRFASALQAWSREDPRREPYARDLAGLYLAYAGQLERLGRVDGERYAWGALDALRGSPGRWDDDPVFFYGFDDLHGLERDAIETLSRIADAEVTVSLTFEAGRPALGARAELVAELRALATRVVELEPRDEHYAPASRRVLHHLERSLFEPGPVERIEPGLAIGLLESAGELAEAELVAAEVQKIVRDGVPPAQIAVIHRRMGPGLIEALAQTFARYGVPLAVPLRLPFPHTALGRSLLALARCGLDEPRATSQDVLTYLRTPGLLRRAELADELEVKIRRGVLRGVAAAREVAPFELDEIDRLRAAEDQLGELIRHARRLLAAPWRGQAPRLGRNEALEARALAALVSCHQELSEIGELPGGREVVELLERLEVSLPAGNDSEAVLVSEPLAVRARRFAVVFVCGLQEGSFPWSPAPDPFLPDERRRELAVASGLRLAPQEDALDRERYLFYACVSRATDRVVLSYRSSDEEGNLALPSPFLDDVADVLAPGWRDSRRRRLLADVVWPLEEAPTDRERARTLAASGEGPGASGMAAPRNRRLGPGALAHVRHTEVLSAGGLESYASCHMKWLVERELQPARFDAEPEALARGSYVHKVLERLLSRLGGPVTPETLPEALAPLEAEMAEIAPGLAPGRPEALRRAVAATIAADLRRFLDYEASSGRGWPAAALEQRFGFPGEEASLPPLLIEREGGRVALRGAIDRIDVEPASRRAVVRDYKTSSARAEYQGNRWQSDQQLQVALYMVAVRELLGLEPVAGLYQPLVGRELRPRGIFLEDTEVQSGLYANDARSREALEAELEHACRRAVELAEELRAGSLEPSPETCGRDGCRYPGICRAQ